MHSKVIKSNGSGEAALLRVQEVATRLAISPRSVWRLVSLSELDTVRIGKSVRVTRSSVESFIAKGGAR